MRPYETLLQQIDFRGDREQRMKSFVDLLWDTLHPGCVSWLGFYIHRGGEELILGPQRDKPACSPIGLHGACGRAFLSREPLIVRDVRDLGPNYIACDPRDQSEIVIPLLEADGGCWGVFDVDSYDLGAFDADDARWLVRLLERAGLTHSGADHASAFFQ